MIYRKSLAQSLIQSGQGLGAGPKYSIEWARSRGGPAVNCKGTFRRGTPGAHLKRQASYRGEGGSSHSPEVIPQLSMGRRPHYGRTHASSQKEGKGSLSVSYLLFVN